MKSTTKLKKRTTSRKSLAGRLTAYSAMAGAALAFMPAADGALVSTNNFTIANAPSSIDEGFVQGQQVRSQKVRHHRQAGMHVLSSGCSSSTTTGNGAGE